LSDALLELRGITKSFPGVQALKNVSLDIKPGEIHGLVGENGAGKTTLLRILCGIYSPTKGKVLLRGQPIYFSTPVEASLHGIAAVHQEMSLCPALSVAENIFFNRQPVRGPLRFIDRKRLISETQQILAKLKLHISPTALVRELSIAEQQQVEILKALAMNPDILLLDEPTSSLSIYETDLLFQLLTDLREAGTTILYVSHKLHEVMSICDRVSVLRDGEYVGTLAQDNVDEQSLVQMMTGRRPSELYPPRLNPEKSKPRFEIRGLEAEVGLLKIKNVNLNVYPGEIVGIAGLVGSGRTELAQTIFGIHPKKAGVFFIDGVEVHINSPWDAIQHGIGYVPEDRKTSGLFLRMPVTENIVVNKLPAVSVHGFISRSKAHSEAREWVSTFNIKVARLDQMVGYLSGGNQQKILLAKVVATNPRVLLVDEPTRGIDVGAKREIHFLLQDLAKKGTGIIMISSELEEVLGLSNRVYVMYNGQIVGELPGDQTNGEAIMQTIVEAAKKGD